MNLLFMWIMNMITDLTVNSEERFLRQSNMSIGKISKLIYQYMEFLKDWRSITHQKKIFKKGMKLDLVNNTELKKKISILKIKVKLKVLKQLTLMILKLIKLIWIFKESIPILFLWENRTKKKLSCKILQ